MSENESVMISVEIAPESLKPHLHALLMAYLDELSAYDEMDDDYPYFDEYWRSGARWPYVIIAGGEIAGFALVNDWSVSQLGTEFAVAEFYIRPAFRRNAIGQHVFKQLLENHHGQWELSVMDANEKAYLFWQNALQNNEIEDLHSISQDGSTIYRFKNRK